MNINPLNAHQLKPTLHYMDEILCDIINLNSS